MQIASVSGNQPWIASVHFVADDENNIFWLSWPQRRHSQEIDKNCKAAIAIVVKTDLPVIGIQAEGKAEVVNDEKMVKKVMQKYIAKYGNGKKFYANFVAGNNKHQMYKFTSQNIKLFDEVNFPEQNQTVS
jgi:uncharacterized protein YhbP (UPF0306 family)